MENKQAIYIYYKLHHRKPDNLNNIMSVYEK